MNSARRRALHLLAGAALLPRASRAQVSGTPGCDAQAPLPARFRLVFDAQASRGPLTLDGENELVFDSDGSRYTLRSSTRSVLFSAEQTSSGELAGDAPKALLVPHQYAEKTQRRAARTTSIDWAAGTVSFSANEAAPAKPRPGMQDRLSMLLQAGQQLRRQQGKGAVELLVAGVRHLSTYRLELRGSDPLDLPAGRFDAWRLERPLDAEHDGIEIWIAPALCWLPVRLRYTDDRGQVIQNRLREARFD